MYTLASHIQDVDTTPNKQSEACEQAHFVHDKKQTSLQTQKKAEITSGIYTIA